MERVPRYTSYPTAAHFSSGVGEKHYRNWIKSLDHDQKLSLYVHIPFCNQLCWFCGCHTKIVNKYEPVREYLALLKKEIDLVSGGLGGGRVQHLHFGGGSPSMIRANDFAALILRIREMFDIEKEIEIAIEIDPRTIDEEKISSYAKSGVTRASLGVQDFDHQVQKAIHRIQPFEMVDEVVSALRQREIKEISFDLIYGLPNQTLETMEATIHKTLCLAPNRISLFGYAHVPWMKKHQKMIPLESLPDSSMRISMFNLASKLILQSGYVAIGLDHFVRPDDPMSIALEQGTLNRNFQGYTTDTADVLLGLGVSAISTLQQGYSQNASNIGEYRNLLNSGALPVIRGIELRDDDSSRRDIIMSLMSNMRAKVPNGLYTSELASLQTYFESGVLTYDNEILRVSPDARTELRLIASAFDKYLESADFRYSTAV